MTCYRIGQDEESKLSAWLDGELSEREGREVEDHVAGCEACAELVAAFREMRSALAVELDPDPGFVVRFRERRDERSIAPWWTWRQLALRLAPLAIAVMLLAWIAVAASISASSSSSGPDLRTLEAEALGSSAAFAPGSPAAEEPVLSIALGGFPGEDP